MNAVPTEPSPTVRPPVLPALVVGQVAHARRAPSSHQHSFRHRHYQWLVDLADLPGPRWPWSLLARFEDADHLDGGRLGGGLRGDVERFLAHRDVPLQPQDRVLMLAHARVLGHTFDPLTVFWCLAPDGRIRAVVFEVHNTYGERHAYLLRPDEQGRAGMDKAFYVSPFNDTQGRYAVQLTLTPQQVAVSVALDRHGERVLTASTVGAPEPATKPALARLAVTHTAMTVRVSALIRWHGIRLWARRLPIRPRPTHTEEAVR